MKQYILISFVILTILIKPELSAQSDNEVNSYDRVNLSLGISFTHIKDARFSAITKRLITPKFELSFEKYRANYRTEFRMGYNHKIRQQTNGLLAYKFFRPDIHFNYQRRVNNNWWGVQFNSTTLLNFPISSTGMFKNNPISYSIINGIGPSFRFESQDENSALNWSSDIYIPLLSYVIRPAFGHPYPESYLRSGTFHPDRRGMGKSLVKGGKLQTLNKQQSLVFRFTISYAVGSRYQFNCSVNFEYSNNTYLKQSRYSAQELLMGFSYIY